MALEAKAQAGGRIAVWPDHFPPEAAPFSSPAIKADGWVFVAQHLATDGVTGIATEARPDLESPYRSNPLELQSRRALRNVALTLEAAGCEIGRDAARIYQWFASPYPTLEEFKDGITWSRIDDITPYFRSRNELIHTLRPASTAIAVRELPVSESLIGIDLIAVEPTDTVAKRGFDIPPEIRAERAVPGYELAIGYGDWVFLAGEGPTDLKGDFMSEVHMGEPSGISPEARVNPYYWAGLEIEAQTENTLRRLAVIAEAAGTSLDRCVKAEVWIGHPDDYWGMERIWKEWFPTNPPARVVIPFMGLAIKGSRVEIEMKLLAGDSDLEIETIETSEAPEPFGHEPQAVKAGNLVFFSTQLPVDSRGRVPIGLRRDRGFPYYSEPAALQMRAILDNLAAISAAAGTSLENLCRVQAFYDDFRPLPSVLGEWTRRFGDDPPATSTIRVGGEPLLAPGAHLLLDAIGYAPPAVS